MNDSVNSIKNILIIPILLAGGPAIFYPIDPSTISVQMHFF